MANRETYPASQSPLQGDLSGTAGATTVTVVGLQTVPVAPGTPPTGADLVFDGTQWSGQLPANIALELNGQDFSDDWEFMVNNVSLDMLVGWSYGFAFKVFINGVGVTGT